jgi:hypothetical protein
MSARTNESAALGGTSRAQGNTTTTTDTTQRSTTWLFAEAPITKGERTDLQRLIRDRAKVARADIDAQVAQQLATVEAQLAARYEANLPIWAEITQRAEQAVQEAEAQIAQLCRERGIPERFRPGFILSWYGRGENADKYRRAELRKVAETELAARAKRAKVEIDRSEVAQLTALTRTGLTSAEGRAFLQAMPSVEHLMPPLSLSAVEALAPPLKDD